VYKEIKEQIRIEIKNLGRLMGEMKQLIKTSEHKKNFIEIRAAGSILHDFYCGAERIFRRISLTIDKNPLKGEDWHTELLSQMAKPIEGTRNSVISEDLVQKLKEYLRFRHLFIHIYGFELKWDKIKPLCFDMESLFENLKQ
jgi:hypothetical protein